MSAIERIDRDTLPVNYTPDDARQPTVTVMTGHGRNKNQPLFVFEGPEGGELVVEFDRVYYDEDRSDLVLVKVNRADRRDYERKVFTAEHWGQWGAVSDWFYENGIDEVPRRVR